MNAPIRLLNDPPTRWYAGSASSPRRSCGRPGARPSWPRWFSARPTWGPSTRDRGAHGALGRVRDPDGRRDHDAAGAHHQLEEGDRASRGSSARGRPDTPASRCSTPTTTWSGPSTSSTPWPCPCTSGPRPGSSTSWPSRSSCLTRCGWTRCWPCCGRRLPAGGRPGRVRRPRRDRHPRGRGRGDRRRHRRRARPLGAPGGSPTAAWPLGAAATDEVEDTPASSCPSTRTTTPSRAWCCGCSAASQRGRRRRGPVPDPPRGGAARLAPLTVTTWTGSGSTGSASGRIPVSPTGNAR